MPMAHSWATSADNLTVEYRWRKKSWNSLKVIAEKTPSIIQHGSEEEFITEHYWGYTKLGDRRTSEYGVEHPKWEVYRTKDYTIDVDFGNIYGEQFYFLKNERPRSVFLAEGSEIKVKEGQII